MSAVDAVITSFNAATSAALAGLTVWAILSHRVKDGVVIKAGLMCLALGLAVTAWHLVDGIGCEDLLPLNRARALINVGLLISLAGYAREVRAGRTWRDLIDMP
jgi:hypothetical protein